MPQYRKLDTDTIWDNLGIPILYRQWETYDFCRKEWVDIKENMMFCDMQVSDTDESYEEYVREITKDLGEAIVYYYTGNQSYGAIRPKKKELTNVRS